MITCIHGNYENCCCRKCYAYHKDFGSPNCSKCHVERLLYDGNGSYDVGKFFESLSDYGKQYLHDNDGSEDFAGYEQWFIDNGNFHLFSCTADTMTKLHLFADLDDERRGELMKNLQKHTL